jgi:alpha-galactosidase/6-phospho-beta-glucosidase family protein
VVEVQGLVSGAGIRGVAVPPLLPKLVAGAMNDRWQQAELMVTALRTGDRDLLLLDLLSDHRTKSLEQAEGLLDEWLVDPRNERIARIFK